MRVLCLGLDRALVQAISGKLPAACVRSARDQAEGLRLAAEGNWNLILLAEEFAGAGLELLERFVRERLGPVVILAHEPSLTLTMEAIGRGAHDVLPKPLPPERLSELLESVCAAGRVRPLPDGYAAEDALVGSSPQMLSVFKLVARAAQSDATVLVLGESGTGKERVARTLHARSARAAGPFVAINCAAIPENLLESELFGHEKGAFTGAIGRRIGRFERASGGTLFLDEIGDMSLALQSKILRALQERKVERVGGGAPVPIDVRLVAATNQELDRAVAQGRFRDDLFYRLAVVTIRLPPLRERGADLDRLAEHFAALYAREHHRSLRGLSEETLRVLRAHPWPGNVRQLRNAMERAVVMAEGDVVLPRHLPADVLNPAALAAAPDGEPLCTLAEMESRLIRRALRETGHNLTAAAERLGIHRNTLRRKLVLYGLNDE